MSLDHAVNFEVVTEGYLMEEATSLGEVFLWDVHEFGALFVRGGEVAVWLEMKRFYAR